MESEEIPTIVQFSPQGGNGTVVGISELVEVAGVEPASESTLTELSPGADGYCGGPRASCSPSGRQAVTHVRSGKLHNVWHRQSLLYAHLPLYDALPGSRSFRVGRPPLIRQRKQQYRCCLIYKVPILWRLGAAAR